MSGAKKIRDVVTMSDDQFVVRYTTKDIMKKLDEQHTLLEAIHKQATLTNGRVTFLEKKSLGFWVNNHPWQTFIILALFFIIVISDFRHPLVEFLVGLI